MSDRALGSAYTVADTSVATIISYAANPTAYTTLPRPTAARRQQSLYDTPFDASQLGQDALQKKETVLYLAYGSNLSVEKFRGARGIRPLSQINVQVPSLRMTFDLPGLPYHEPCFANSARRDPENDPPEEDWMPKLDEKTRSLDRPPKYRKNRWHKGLIGVVYECTPEDYAHIIATEGGGAGYQDVLVDCHPFEDSDPSLPVPQNPTSTPFKAHTLFAPPLPPGEEPPKHGGHFQRPDPAYAQASARYLKLITDGAAELRLPYEYQEYLQSLQHYKITTARQRLGYLAFSVTWMPLLLIVFSLGKLFVNKEGKLPVWMRELTSSVFRAIWINYDHVLKPTFGDGERTIGDKGGDKVNYSFRTQKQGQRKLSRDADVEKLVVDELSH